MTISTQTLSYLLNNSQIFYENQIIDDPDDGGFETIVMAHPEKLSGTNRVLNKFASRIQNCQDDGEERQLLLDYSAFKHFLIKYYKSGVDKKEDPNCSNPYFADTTKFNKTEFNNCFQNQPFVKKYCDDTDVDELSSEPVLLFDDEDCVKSVYEMKLPKIMVIRPAIDTQIMAEAAPQQPSKTYQLDQVLITIGKIFQVAKNLGSADLAKSITQLRAALIRLNDKPIPLRYRVFGNQYPPEAFVAWRLEEKLNFLKARGTRLLQVIKQAEDDENGITPEEIEDIKEAFRNILLTPSKKFTVKSMGPFTTRAVTNLENKTYFTSPQQLADDFSESLQARAEKVNAPNPYYFAMQQMFNQIPAAPTQAPTDQFARTPNPNQNTQAGQTAPTQATNPGAQSYSPGTINLNDPMQNRAWMGLINNFVQQAAQQGPRGIKPQVIKQQLQKIVDQIK